MSQAQTSGHAEGLSAEVRQETRDGGRLAVVELDPFAAPEEMRRLIYDLQARQVELEQQNAELRESEARFHMLFENMEEGFALQEVVTDEAGQIVDFRYLETNQAFERHSGLNGRSVIGKTVRELIPNADPRQIEVHANVARTGEPLTFEYFSRPLGRYLRVRSYRPKPGFLAVIFEDVNDRRQAEDALRQSEARLHEVLENATDASYKRNLHTNSYEYLSPVFTQISGYTPDEMKTLPIEVVLKLMHPDDMAEVARVVAASMTTAAGTAHQVEYRFRHKDGHYRWLMDRFTVVCSADGNPDAMIGSVSDITDRREHEDEIRRLNATLELRVAERTIQLQAALAELKRADQMKDEFMAAVSHELRTPLTGVLGMVDALELQFSDSFSERQVRYVRGIRQSGDRLLALVNNILRYTGLLSGNVNLHHESCRLDELGAIAVRSVRSSADQKAQSVEFNIEPAGLTIVSDADGIIQSLQQLLNNAVKFTPVDGRIGLDVRKVFDQNAVQLVVWDTGIGISPEQQAVIFQPFVQGDAALSRKYTGMGLGLAYAQRMVELLGGSITLESTLGQGSRFTITLPYELAHTGSAPART